MKDERSGDTPADGEVGREAYLPFELIEGGAESSEDAPDGLELDERQSEEIRRIFGTTLPEYLQPVSEMVNSLLEPSGSTDGETLQAVLATVSSLAAAAARMGFGEVGSLLEELHRDLAALEVGRAVAPETRERILGHLLDLEDLGSRMGGAAGEARETLFKALGGVAAFGPAVVKRLSIAGLMTVEQLRNAKLDEVAVVSGLDPALVAQIFAHLGIGERVAPSPDRSKAPAAAAAPEVETALRQTLRAQVEAEAALEEARAEVRRLGHAIQEQRSRLDEQARTQVEARHARERALERERAALARLDGIRAKRDELARRYAVGREWVREREVRLLALRRERQELCRREEEVDLGVDALAENVGRLLRTLSRGQQNRR